MRKTIKKEKIITERLIIKSYEEKDLVRLVEILENKEIQKTFMIPDYEDEKQYYEMAEKLIRYSKPEDESHLEYGIYKEDVLIGFLNDCGFDEKTIEIGYVIHPEYKGKGYATEAFSAVINNLWEMGFETVCAGYFEGNDASRRIMEKCGLAPTGKTEEIEYRGKKHKVFYCEKNRPDRS